MILTKLLATVKTRDRQGDGHYDGRLRQPPTRTDRAGFFQRDDQSANLGTPSNWWTLRQFGDSRWLFSWQAASTFRFIDLARCKPVDTSKPLRIRSFHGGPELKAIHKPQAAFQRKPATRISLEESFLEAVVGTDGSVKEAKSVSGPRYSCKPLRMP